MFNFKQMFLQILAAGAVGFGAAISAAFMGDVSGALAAAHGGVGAAVAVALGLAGNLIKQLIDRARGVLASGSAEAVEYLDLAEQYIGEAKQRLG